MQGKIEYAFSTKMWRYESQGGWYFVSLPKDMSKEIRTHLGWQEEGLGRMKTTAKIETTAWETAIWFDTKADTYILPIKVEIRKKTKLEIDKSFEMCIFI